MVGLIIVEVSVCMIIWEKLLYVVGGEGVFEIF